MRRPPIACPRAAHSLTPASVQHIWISDDLLSLVLYRFFRGGCPHQKRHGSHVPGPLEARRRAVKRQMTAQAHVSPQGGLPPPPFSLGGLFGVRSSPQPSWRYEPPSMSRPQEPLNFPFETPSPVPDISPDSSSPEPNEACSDSTSPKFSFLEIAPQLPRTEWQEEVKTVVEKASSARLSEETSEVKTTRKIGPETVENPIGVRKTSGTRTPEKNTGLQTLPRKFPVENDTKSCLASFKGQIKAASKLPDTHRHEPLRRAIQSCYPAGEQAGNFSLLVLQQLRREQWSPSIIVACLSEQHVPLPDLRTPTGREFVRQVRDMATGSPKRIRKMGILYKRLAATVHEAKNSTQDIGLRILYRAFWEHALRSQENNLEASTVEVLHKLGNKFSNPLGQIFLGQILSDPTHAVNQIILLVRSCDRRTLGETCVGELVLDCIPRNLLHTWIPSFPRRLFQMTKDQTPSQRVGYLENWLRILDTLDSQVVTAAEGVEMSALALKSIAAYGIRPSTIGRYLTTIQPHSLVNALLYWIPHQKSSRDIPSERINDFIQSHRLSLARHAKSCLSLNELLARLLSRMQKQSLPNHEMASLITYLVYQHKNLRSVLDILRRLKSKGAGLSDTAFLHKFMNEVLAPNLEATRISTHLHPQRSAFTLHVCQSIRALNLDCDDKMDKVLDTLQSRQQLHHILDRARDAHVLPLSYRTMPFASLMNERAELIHQIAYQYSIDRTRTRIQNWRSIFYLFKYLCQHQLPIGPLFTRSVVRVCIIQPLSQNEFVGSRRLIWVCQLVAKTEGVDVARKIEQIFWVWRGDLIAHAKRTLHECGGTGKAHVTTMKRLGLI